MCLVDDSHEMSGLIKFPEKKKKKKKKKLFSAETSLGILRVNSLNAEYKQKQHAF